MSFHSIKIVKDFSKNKKYVFKKSKSIKFNKPKNISIEISKKKCHTIDNSKDKTKEYIYNTFRPFEINSNINNKHSIGFIIVNSISLNKLHNLLWDSDDKIYLNVTKLLLHSYDKFPILEIPDNIYKQGFKFKKFLKTYILKEWFIKKKYIEAIKLLGNYNNTHIYTVIVNNCSFINDKSFLKGKGKNYKWRNIFDQYNIEKKECNIKEISQKDIFKKILINRNTSLVKYNLLLNPYIKDNDNYSTEINLDYEIIIHQLSSY